jgi:hypothetical protein
MSESPKGCHLFFVHLERFDWPTSAVHHHSLAFTTTKLAIFDLMIRLNCLSNLVLHFQLSWISSTLWDIHFCQNCDCSWVASLASWVHHCIIISVRALGNLFKKAESSASCLIDIGKLRSMKNLAYMFWCLCLLVPDRIKLLKNACLVDLPACFDASGEQAEPNFRASQAGSLPNITQSHFSPDSLNSHSDG